ncbi:MAG: CBM96 family carbohydrate-binding protein, partial [Thermoproteota archaeon]
MRRLYSGVVIILLLLLVFPQFVLFGEAQQTSILSPVGDSWVEAEFPNDNHGSDTSLRVRSDSRTRRSYLKFDLSSIPNGKTITSVKIYLYCTYADANPNVEIYVHETGDS